MVGSEIGRLPPQFGDASKIANAVLSSGFEFDSGKLFYNKFRSVVSYKTNEVGRQNLLYGQKPINHRSAAVFSTGIINAFAFVSLCRFPSFPWHPSARLRNWVFTTPSTLTSSNLTWNIPWHPLSTIAWRRVHALSSPLGWPQWITPARTLVRIIKALMSICLCLVSSI